MYSGALLSEQSALFVGYLPRLSLPISISESQVGKIILLIMAFDADQAGISGRDLSSLSCPLESKTK